MVEMGILYSDLSKVWKPVSDAGLFIKTGVLTFSFTTQRGNRSALVQRRWSRQNNDIVAARDTAWWGDDIYYVGILPNGDFFTAQLPVDDEEIITFSDVDGTNTGIATSPRTFPADAIMHKFIGDYLNPGQWQIALAIFETEMF